MIDDDTHDLYYTISAKGSSGAELESLSPPTAKGTVKKFFHPMIVSGQQATLGQLTYFSLDPDLHGRRDMQSAYTYLSRPVTSSIGALNQLNDPHQIDKRPGENEEFNPRSNLHVSTFFNTL